MRKNMFTEEDKKSGKHQDFWRHKVITSASTIRIKLEDAQCRVKYIIHSDTAYTLTTSPISSFRDECPLDTDGEFLTSSPA